MDKKQRPSYLVSIEEQTDESKSLLETVQENSTVRGTQNVHDSVRESYFRKEDDLMVSEQKTPLNEAQEEKEDEEIDLNPTPYEKASFINIMHYFYVLQYLWRLRKKRKQTLTLDDTPRIGKTEEVNYKINGLEIAYLNYRKKNKEPSLFWPVTRVFRVDFLKQQTLVLISWSSKILSALSLCKLLGAIEDEQRSEAYKWTFCLFGAVIVSLYSHQLYYFTANRSVQQFKLALTGLMYRKINKLSFYSINQVSIGKIINIIANDLNSFEFYAYLIYPLIAAPFALGATLAILWSFFGVASLTGIVFVFLLNPIQGWLANLGAKYVSQKNSFTDERVKLTNEMIESIRPLKMYGWNMKYTESIMNARNQEIALLTKVGYCDFIGSHLFSKLSPVLASFLIFLTYGLMGGTLKTSRVYSTIIILFFLRSYLISHSSLALRFITEAKLTFKRIVELLEVEERDLERENNAIQPSDSENSVEFADFSAFWGEQTASPTLKSLNFSVKKGSLCAIIGRVGSGKTTTLLSFLNEIPKTTGELRYSGSIAYVEQAPSIYPGTLRSNILFGKPYDEQKYNRVVEAACLIDDFKEFANGDLTEIGEKGVNLSGGQKARTSLARALYSDADIYLLDDPLSAVDSKVAKNIFHKAIRGLLKNKIVLLVTHQIHFAKEVEKIVLLENGEVKAVGVLDEIIRQDAGVMSIFEAREKPAELRSEVEHPSPSLQDDHSRERRDETSPLLSKRDGILHLRKEDNSNCNTDELTPDEALSDDGPKKQEENRSEVISKEAKGKLISQETNDSMKVGWGTYWFYLKNTGSLPFILIFAFNLSLVEIIYVVYTRSLGYWTEGIWTPIFSMKVLGIVLLAFFLLLALREVLYVRFGLNVSKKLHNKILHTVAGAKIEFFDTNLAGRILNRFSNDIGILDRFILRVQDETIDTFFSSITLFITICIFFPVILLPGVALVLVLLLLFKYFKNFILKGRGLELLTRSPIYSLFSLTLSEITSIRVYGQENRFIREFTRLLNQNTRAFVFYYDVTRAFSFYCDLPAGLFISGGIMTLISLENVEPALIGLACCYFLTFTAQVQFALRQTLMHIMQMASTH